ncbi:MAG TPA: S-layer homology domain-containing protein, partial [Vicinamibacterales bacterium]
AAEEHARRAVELGPNDAESHAALGAVLEAQERYREAAAEFGRAAAIDPRPVWRERNTALREKANLSAIPAEFRELTSAATVSRAQAAALIGTRLEVLVERAPRRGTAVATDVQNHWAAPWILPVTQAGIMEIQPNHTFQPGAALRRADLARVVSQLLAVVAAERQIDLGRWRAARPRFADLPATNLFYNAAALAVASGAMDTPEGSRFLPTRPATGAELLAAIDRIEQLAGR